MANLTNLSFYTDGSLQTQQYNNLRHLPIEDRITTIQSAAFIEINTSIRYTPGSQIGHPLQGRNYMQYF